MARCKANTLTGRTICEAWNKEDADSDVNLAFHAMRDPFRINHWTVVTVTFAYPRFHVALTIRGLVSIITSAK